VLDITSNATNKDILVS